MFANNSAVNIKLSKSQLHKTGESREAINEAKKQKAKFFRMFLGTLGASLLEN